jgi:hypothetical protein
MAEVLVVFDNIKDWAVPVISRKNFLTIPKLSLNLRQPLPDDVEKKQKGILEKAYQALFDKQFFTMSNAHFAKVQASMDRLEADLAKMKADPSSTDAKIDAQIAMINAKLKSDVDAWKPKVEKLHTDCFDKAMAKSDAEMKKKVKRAKLKVILVAVLIVLVALTAIALTIATAGAGAPLILAIVGGIVAAALALKKFGGEFKSAWDLCQGKIADIEKEVAASEKTHLELLKLDLKSADKKSVLEKAKALKAKVSLGSANIDKHVGQLEKFAANFNSKLKDYKQNVDKLKKQADDLKEAGKPDAEQQALILEQNQLIEKMNKRLAAVAEVRGAAAAITAKIKANGVPDFPKLRKALDAFGQCGAVLKELFSGISKIGSSAAKLKG